MRLLRRILFIGLFVLVLVAGWRFAYGNATTVTVDYVLGDIPDVRLWKALLTAAGLGAALTGMVLGFELARARLEARRYRKALLRLQSELESTEKTPQSGGEIPPSAASNERRSARPVVLSADGAGGRSA